MFAAIILASLGQYRQCQTAASYRQQAATYYAPTYYQAATYYAPKAYVETKFVAIEDPYYASIVGQQVRAELKAKDELRESVELSAQVKALSDRVGQLAATIGAAGGGAPAPPPVQPPAIDPDTSVPPPPLPVPQKPTPNPGPNPALPQGPALPDPSPGMGSVVPPPPPSSTPIDAASLSILDRRCAKCHTSPAKVGKGFVIFEAPGKLAPLSPLDKLLIDQQIYSGEMPSGGKPLESDEYSRLRAWINEDREAIEAAVKLCQEKQKQKGGN